MTDARIHWGRIATRFGTFAAWVDGADRLVRFSLGADSGSWPSDGTVEDEAAIAEVARQVGEYCAGTRRAFDLAWTAMGPPFERDVWYALAEIPFGETASYGEIARLVGRPEAARAVGIACARNPLPLVVPCHRVIGTDGGLAGFGGGLALKRALLDFESAAVGRPRDLFAVL